MGNNLSLSKSYNLGLNLAKLAINIELANQKDRSNNTKIKLYFVIERLTEILEGIAQLDILKETQEEMELYLNNLLDKYGELKTEIPNGEMLISRFKSKISTGKHKRTTLSHDEAAELKTAHLLWSDRINITISNLPTIVIHLPYLTKAPISVANGDLWMEADGLHIYYNGAEKVVAGV